MFKLNFQEWIFFLSKLTFEEFVIYCIAVTALVILVVTFVAALWIVVSKWAVIGLIWYFAAIYVLYKKTRRGQ